MVAVRHRWRDRGHVGWRRWARAERRDQLTSLVVLAVLAGLAGAVPTAAVAGARRGDTAFERFAVATRSPEGFVNLEGTGAGAAERLEAVEEMPGVTSMAPYAVMGIAPRGAAGVTFVGTDDRFGRDLAVPVVIRGGLPATGRVDGVAVNELAADRFDVEPGDQLRLESLGAEGFGPAPGAGPGEEAPGPSPTVEVTAVVRHPFDFINPGSPQIYPTAAFFRRWRDDVFVVLGAAMVDLADGALVDDFLDAFRQEFGGDPDARVEPLAFGGDPGTRGAVNVQVVALQLFALCFGAAGVVAVGQAVVRRHHRTGDQRTLAALGLTRAQRALGIVAVIAPFAIAAGALAALGAWVASSLFPLGIARDAEPSPGREVDGLVLLGGALITVLVVLFAGAAGARAATMPRGPRRHGTAHRRASGPIARGPRSVVAAEGVRTGLRGTSGSRARPALAGAAVGAAGVVAALVFGASLERLLGAPDRYGWSWDAELVVVDGGEGAAELLADTRTIGVDPAVVGAGLGIYSDGIILDGRNAPAFGLDAVAGDVGFTVTAGRGPSRPDEVVLGRDTLSSLGVGLGDVVVARGVEGERRPLTVVGEALFPVIADNGYDFGAGLTRAGFERLDASEPQHRHVVRLADGADRDTVLDRLDRFGEPNLPTAPVEVANLRSVDGYPAVLAGSLALLAVAVVGHDVLVGTRRRRREAAILRAVGLTRGQIGRVVWWWTLTVVAVACVCGVLLGVPMGRAAWRLLAHDLGVASDVAVPLWRLGAVVVGAVVVAGFISVVPGRAAARQRPTDALRVE